jgi:hypothetical protein
MQWTISTADGSSKQRIAIDNNLNPKTVCEEMRHQQELI